VRKRLQRKELWPLRPNDMVASDMSLVLIVGGTVVVVMALMGAAGYLLEMSADKHEADTLG
jgi:hypothetical protein